jgi:hypothetical protein
VWITPVAAKAGPYNGKCRRQSKQAIHTGNTN